MLKGLIYKRNCIRVPKVTELKRKQLGTHNIYKRKLLTLKINCIRVLKVMELKKKIALRQMVEFLSPFFTITPTGKKRKKKHL